MTHARTHSHAARRVLPLAAVGGALILTAFSPLRAQTLTNPGFEGAYQAVSPTADTASDSARITGSIAPGWSDNTSWAKNVAIDYGAAPDDPHGGASSQRITVTQGFAQFVQPVTFTAGRHRASVWMRAKPAQWVSLSLRQNGSPYAGYAGTPVKVGAAWIKVTTAGLTPDVGGYVMVNLSGPGTVWLDDGDLGQAAAQQPAVSLSPSAEPIPPTYFGLNVNHMHDAPGFDWPALPFGTFRTWDSGDVWPGIETARGVYNWTNMDKDVAEAQAHHAEFLFTLGGTPRWATSAPDSKNSYVGYTVPPDNLQDWKDFLTAVATRYKGRIRAYEVWNEPDLSFYTGTPAQLVAMERAAAQVIHRVDPSALVLTPPPSGVYAIAPLKWFDSYLQAGGGRSADVIPYHQYDGDEEANIEEVREFRALLAQYGLAAKSLWLTEVGRDRPGVSEADGAAFVARTFLIGHALGLHRVFWYAYDNGPAYFSLDEADNEGKTRDPHQLGASGIAYREVERWLLGARMLSCARSADGVWTAGLRRADGSRAWAVWCPGGPRSFPVPAAWRVRRLQDLAGATRAIQDASVPLGPAPVLLTP